MINFQKYKGNLIHDTAIIDWEHVTIGKGNKIYPYCNIGVDASHSKQGSCGKVNIGNNNIFRENVNIQRPIESSENKVTFIGDDNYFMSNVVIGHDCVLESNIVLGNNTTICGHTYVMKHTTTGVGVSIHQFQVIGSYSMIGLNSVIDRAHKVKPGLTFYGIPAKCIAKNTVGLERNKISDDILEFELDRYQKIYDKHFK
ncbi:hypothetical protein N8753_01705 [Pelagibacteraceae bacterium]|nr:hypothetical protein [Pelagibacteraceae bacterium]